jgi:hypothetical protein
MTHITEITPTLKQNTAHRTTQAIKDTKYSANHYRYILCCFIMLLALKTVKCVTETAIYVGYE